jgi:hypothetical protein
VNRHQWLTRLTPVEEEVEINIQTKMPHILRCMFVLKTNRKENIFGAFHEPETFLPIVMKGVEKPKIIIGTIQRKKIFIKNTI